MFILHVALQGCLRARDVEYGITADTGGHIRYLLDLVEASAQDDQVARIVVATRAFDSSLGADYAAGFERVCDKIEIRRFWTDTQSYLTKEELTPEVESFAEALIAFIENEAPRPDVLHAHYADAAKVAALVEARLGIPFVFTAHSLGRVKASVLDLSQDRSVAVRIDVEEAAIKAASLVIASSRDEAEVQYAAYEAYDPGRIRVLPPGSDLARFRGAASDPAIDAEIARFLRDSGKPVILAIARPVAKKNLAALVEAFGNSPELRERANLVVVAGTRDDYEMLDGDMATTMRDLLHLIDRHDLYGSVAYPKQHMANDIPALYAHAFQRRGVFVNPALNEPFGLTLLEASAVGLPLVATDSGGPNDIIETCKNGILVDPRSSDAIAVAILSILKDPARWASFSKAGERAAAAYDWRRHAELYHGLLRSLLEARPPVEAPRQLLVCDIDNTLIGCEDCVTSFIKWRPQQVDLAFGVATGRSFHSAMAILEQQEMPRPQVMITSVGTEIYRLEKNGTTYCLDRDWATHISRGWDREAVLDVMQTMPGIQPQAPLEQRRHKLSYFTDGSRGIVEKVRTRLESQGLRSSVIHSHGRYLDILPIRASKGTAVEFVRNGYGLTHEAVFVAGDSGNDIEMLRTVPQAIIVANFSDELAALPSLKHSYVAREAYARGIIEGVDHFRAKARLT